MKTSINISSAVTAIIVCIALIASFCADAQRVTVKANGDIGLGSAMSLTTSLPGMTAKSASNAFGIDFGYTFWKRNANSLEVNVGLGYRIASTEFSIPDFSYTYAAPAIADMDGNSYQRCTTLTDVDQKIDLGYFNIPIYLQYQYRVAKWLGIHADFGFGFGFKCLGKVNSTTGLSNAYGIYPEYDDLVIEADYLNDFGDTNLNEVSNENPNINGLTASVIAGAGLEFYLGGPISIDIGVRYNAGLNNVFGHGYSISSSSITYENAPVTYTVSEGQRIKALSDYFSKSQINSLSLHLGINVRF